MAKHSNKNNELIRFILWRKSQESNNPMHFNVMCLQIHQLRTQEYLFCTFSSALFSSYKLCYRGAINDAG